MAPDDRNQSFEKALARHLRSSASPSTNANVLAGAPTERPGELCPDPEILAAYHEGLLSSEERNLWKQHVVGCEQCQLVLAHLASPLEVPVNLGTNEKVVALQQNASFGRAASPAPIARPSPPHNLRWLWLVPVGAIAATFIAWVSLNTPKPPQVVTAPSIEVAENRQPQSVAPLAKTARVAPNEAAQNERKEKDQPTAPSEAGAASARRDLASNQLQNQAQLTQQSPFQAAAKPAHGPYLSQQKQQQEMSRSVQGGRLVDGKKLAAEAEAKLDQEGKSIASQLPPPPSAPSFIADDSVSRPVAGQAGSAGAAAPPPPAPAPASTAKTAAPRASAATADAISTVTESVEVSAAPEASASGRAMMPAPSPPNPPVFWTPNGKQAWRVGPAGSLEYSKDKGTTWTPQISGVYTDLLAGSAPTGKISWIVGASGTILRTTDGGAHWSKLDSPVTNDLTGIRATDATHAQIWFVPDQQTGVIKTYQTTDGGATWSPLSSQR